MPSKDAQITICHTCEEREGGTYRVVWEPDEEAKHHRFMQQHYDCARDGWSNLDGTVKQPNRDEKEKSDD